MSRFKFYLDKINMLAHFIWWREWLWCSWRHYGHRCYPEVWGRGLDGPWHCAECHPCNEALDRIIRA